KKHRLKKINWTKHPKKKELHQYRDNRKMKTLPVLACICVLIACFSLCEGHRRHPEVHRRINHHHGPPFAPRPQAYYPSNYPRYPTHRDLRRRIIIVPLPPKCPSKNNTVVNKNNTSENTQVPLTTDAPQQNLTTMGQNNNSTDPTPKTAAESTFVPDTTTMPTTYLPESSNTTPTSAPEASTAAPLTKANKEDKASQILSDLNKLWKHILGVLNEK
ncbi:hypothetical protein NP303_24880, partial [Salmonella enterica]|nr:hypothetical protein [Salmonella enterica]